MKCILRQKRHGQASVAVGSRRVAEARGIYSIGSVARMLGLSQPAIRSWEDRYGLIVAERTEGGRRLYTRDQVEQLRFVKERVDEGLSAADAHRLLAERQAGAHPIVEPTANPRRDRWSCWPIAIGVARSSTNCSSVPRATRSR